MKSISNYLAICSALVASLAVNAPASTISLDENGHGTIDGTPLAFTATGSNPLPPFQSPVLTYTLPFTGVAGNVELLTPGVTPVVPEAELEFTGSSSVIFYSAAGGTDLADRYSPPIFPFPVTNTVRLTQTSSGLFVYTPASGQPGFDASAPTYDFVVGTPTTVPEPASEALFSLGGVALVLCSFVRKRKIQTAGKL